MKILAAVSLGLALAGFGLPNAAQAAYPDKPVRFIVPYAPGGGTDIVARILAQKLGEIWRQPVVIDNRPGAGSTLGTGLAVKAPADGYTMVLSSVSLAFDTAIYKDLPYDTVRDLAPVSLVASQPDMLVVNPSLPAKSVAELIALAKAKPGTINYASGGIGSGPHLAMELFKRMAHVDMTHIAYKGTGPAMNDLLGGRVPVMIAVTASALPFVQAGKLRALAVTGSKRSASTPGIPTVSEAGVPGYEFNTWYGIQVPAHTPAPIITRMNAAIAQALQSPDVRQRLIASGLEPLQSTPEAFGKLIRSEVRKWGDIANSVLAKEKQ